MENNSYITYYTIHQKIENGSYEMKDSYPEKKYHTIDENKTVKWNREQDEKIKKENQEAIIAYHENESSLYKEFKNDIIEYIYSHDTINEKQAIMIFNLAKEKYEAYDEILDEVEDIIKIFETK